MLNNFQTIIFREVDETNDKRGVWVRMSPSHWGVSIATFKEQPTEETPEWQAMTSIHFDPCFDNRSKITAWNEHSDPENSDGCEFILVESIDDWKPRPQEESESEGTITEIQEARRLALHRVAYTAERYYIYRVADHYQIHPNARLAATLRAVPMGWVDPNGSIIDHLRQPVHWPLTEIALRNKATGAIRYVFLVDETDTAWYFLSGIIGERCYLACQSKANWERIEK